MSFLLLVSFLIYGNFFEPALSRMHFRIRWISDFEKSDEIVGLRFGCGFGFHPLLSHFYITVKFDFVLVSIDYMQTKRTHVLDYCRY